MKLIHFFSAAAILCLVGSASAYESKERRNDPVTEYVEKKCSSASTGLCHAPNLTSLPICAEGLVLTAADAGAPSCCCPPI